MFELIESEIELNNFYKVGGQKPKRIVKGEEEKTELEEGEASSKYILRGIVVFYGRHYICYFYSEKYDGWYQYDDEKVIFIGNWADVK